VRYVLSDRDGVLVDSGDAVERVWRRWALEHGTRKLVRAP
jgi:beta-phosphoglucomutase-like phosphatase (HAD superfamily)